MGVFNKVSLIPRRFAPGIVPLTLRTALRLFSASVTKKVLTDNYLTAI